MCKPPGGVIIINQPRRGLFGGLAEAVCGGFIYSLILAAVGLD